MLAQTDRLTRFYQFVITFACLSAAFVLMWFHKEGGALFVGLISGSPATALGFAGRRAETLPTKIEAGGDVAVSTSGDATTDETPKK